MEHRIITEIPPGRLLEFLLPILIVGSVALIAAAAVLDLIVWGVGRYRARRTEKR